MAIKDHYDAYEIMDLPGLQVVFGARYELGADSHGTERVPHPAQVAETAPKLLKLYVLRGAPLPF